jgi:hypothetical protein
MFSMQLTLRRSLSTLLALALSAAFLVTTPNAAFAHEGGTDQSDAEHAADDLVGEAMEDIERQTEANAQRIANTTGVRPGQKTIAQQRSINEGPSGIAALDPAIGGSWSSVINTDVVPVFQAVLPNGKILMWDSVGTNPAESYPDQTYTRAMVWNPADNSYKRVDVHGYNIFCAGYSQMANGNVLVAGGNKDQALDGIKQTHIFDWQTETWSRGADMQGERWYPAVTSLANGESFIIAGGPAFAEVYQTNNTIRTLSNITQYSARAYPFSISRPDSKIQLVGPADALFTMNTGGAGGVTSSSTRDGINRDYGSFATYNIGRTLVAGGGKMTEGGQTNVPTKTAQVIDTNGLSTARGATNSMSIGRRQFSMTVLADGTVLATGGQSSATDGLVDLQHPVYAAERWDPATGKWTVLASASRIREYHSAASLLPDGRVLTGGGGVCSACQKYGYLEKNIEYFTPPYLYKKDGSGQLASRPTVSGVPAAISFNTNFAFTSPQAAGIKKVALVRLGAATHGDDQGQRYVPLSYTVNGSSLTALGPVNGGVAPPGYYMLFVTDAAGVPSVANIVNVRAGSTPVAVTIRGRTSNRCIDVPGSNTTNRTRLQIYTCNGTGAQNWTPQSNGSLRALGKCLDLHANKRVNGQPIQIYTCNGTGAQNWTRQTSDGTIRLTENKNYCVSVVSNSTTQAAKLELRACNNSTSQKWW